MRLLNSEAPLTEAEIDECELVCGIRFPRVLREFYLATNGGVPDEYVLDFGPLDTVVTEFLPLTSKGRDTAIESYKMLVRNRKLVGQQYFPFAVDGGGDYFFADTGSENADVYFYRGDTANDERLVCLNMGFAEFCAELKPE